MIDLDKVKAKLLERRAYLDKKLHAYEDALEETPSADAEERATEREGDEVLEHLGLSGLDEIRHIDAALARIEEGSYGECASCGEDIAEARLEAVPYAVTCIDCARGQQ